MSYISELRQAVGTKRIILPGAAGAIVRNDKILLVKHGSLKKWQIPGGSMELNESVEDTVEREIKEELNIEMKTDKLIAVLSSPKWNMEFPNGDKIQQLTFFFLMKGHFDEHEIKLQNEEVYDYKFFDFNHIPENTMECCKEKIKCLLEFKGETSLR